MPETVWVICDEDCSQGALGFTGERAWTAGVPKPLSAALAAHLAGDNTGTFHVVAAPDAPLAGEGQTPPADIPDAVEPVALVAAEGTLE